MRWLSWWQVMTIICDFLEGIIAYFRDNNNVIVDKVRSNIFRIFHILMYIYVIYFFADIL